MERQSYDQKVNLQSTVIRSHEEFRYSIRVHSDFWLFTSILSRVKTTNTQPARPIREHNQLPSRMLTEREVVLYCDLHGHSRKMNVFMYGCENKEPSLRLQERVFPNMMSRNTSKFKYSSCRFVGDDCFS